MVAGSPSRLSNVTSRWAGVMLAAPRRVRTPMTTQPSRPAGPRRSPVRVTLLAVLAVLAVLAGGSLVAAANGGPAARSGGAPYFRPGNLRDIRCCWG
jgi:hypothetical protein